MKDRITQFLTSEGISPAEFADKIGVQRSSVSHVLNGRNYPSASFIQKMLSAYKTLNPRWLLLGEGTISYPKQVTVIEPTLFQFPDNNETLKTGKETLPTVNIPVKERDIQQYDSLKDKPEPSVSLNQPLEHNLAQSMSALIDTSLADKEVERIVLFYKDKTFSAYTPSK
jgi:transcriptional regulator with XRE-family HTH domain